MTDVRKKYTPEQKLRARGLYELEGYTLDQIATELGCTKPTVINWKKRNKWGIRGSGLSTEEAAEAIKGSDNVQEMEVLIAELRAANEAMQKELAEKDPNLYHNLYEDEAGVIQYFEAHYGPRSLRDAALVELGADNRARQKLGLDRIDYSQDEDLMASTIAKIARKRLAQRTAHRGRYKQRTLKMARRYEGKEGWHLIQVGMEAQIENEAGQAGTAMAKAKAKGWKIVSPHLCQARDCWLVAAFDNNGLTLNGYCSLECRATDPYLNQNRTDGTSGVQAGVIFDPSREAGVPRSSMGIGGG